MAVLTAGDQPSRPPWSLSQGSDVGSAANMKRRHRSAESSTRPLVVVVSASAVEAGLDGRVAAALQEFGPHGAVRPLGRVYGSRTIRGCRGEGGGRAA